MSMVIKRDGDHWVIYVGGFPMARATRLEVLKKHWPDVHVEGADQR
jgi:hypothetical protein